MSGLHTSKVCLKVTIGFKIRLGGTLGQSGAGGWMSSESPYKDRSARVCVCSVLDLQQAAWTNTSGVTGNPHCLLRFYTSTQTCFNVATRCLENGNNDLIQGSRTNARSSLFACENLTAYCTRKEKMSQQLPVINRVSSRSLTP